MSNQSPPLARIRDSGAYVKKLVESGTEWAYLWGSSDSNRFVRWRVLMGVCFVEAFRVDGITSSGWQAGTIPDSALPSRSLYYAATAWRDNDTAQIWVGGLKESGAKGQVWLYSNGSNDIFCSASWPVELG